MKELEIKQEAFELRKKFGFSASEPIRLKSLLLKEKILTCFLKLDDDFSGMAIKAKNNKFILINSGHPLGRQHFTICHEIYHLFIDPAFSTHKCQSASFDKENKPEYAADTFASYFLIPEEGILEMIPKPERKKDRINLSTVIEIEQYYACSRSALVNRLLFLKLISAEYKDELCKQVIKSAKLHGYPTDLYLPGNDSQIWGDYGSKAKKLFDNEKISEGHYASIMADIGIDIFEEIKKNINQ